MCIGCDKQHNPVGGKVSRSVSVRGPGHPVKLRYIGDSDELLSFEGIATREEYVVGGRINVIEVDSRDLSAGISWAPGLLEMTDARGHKFFEIHVPLAEEIEAEAKAKAMKEEAWEAAEALALPQEEPVKPKRRKRKAESDGQSTISGD